MRRSMPLSVDEVLYRAIKKSGGLSDWDSDGIEQEVRDILRALKREGLQIVRKD